MSEASPSTHGKEGILDTLAKAASDAINLTPEVESYKEQRRKLAVKFGGLIPVMEGEVASVDITQKGADDAYVCVVFKSSKFDQLSLMAAPNHKMKIMLLEDVRGIATPGPKTVESETVREETPRV